MTISKLRFFVVATLCSIGFTHLSGFESAPPIIKSDTLFQGANGNVVFGTRCGTRSHTPVEAARFQKSMNAVRSLRLDGGAVEIPVAFHVVQRNDGSANVTDTQILEQIRVLNESFNLYGYQFILKSVDRTRNTRWTRHLPNTPLESEMKNSLAIDPATTLNIYSCDLGLGLLGYATFPDFYPEQNKLHGVVILYSSVPGGKSSPFNLGKTAVHEVGHYLGLFHTFQGGCSPPGDEVDDTPAEASPASGCPVGRDTCGSPGLDPVNNYMNYSDDVCLTEFTPGQNSRMDAAVMALKPSLLLPVSVPSPDLKVNDNDGPLSISVNQAVDVTVGLNANDMLDSDGDYWLVAQSTAGVFSFDITNDQWVPGLQTTLQAKLRNFAPFSVYSAASLPAGTYTIFFGVDLLKNGVVDSEALYFDSIQITVR